MCTQLTRITANMEEIVNNETAQQQPGLNPSPEEQVFSNALLLDCIWKNLESQDLIRSSLVSKAWFATSRELLIKHRKKYPVCIQIDDESHCRALAKFNAFLEGNYDSGNDDPVIFNGIQIKITKFKHRLENCIGSLPGDPLYQILNHRVESIFGGFSPEEKINNICKVYGKILEKIKFQFVRLENYDYCSSCPFSNFLHLMITRNAGNIVEWGLNTDNENRLLPDFLRKYGYVQNSVKFSNLEELSITKVRWASDWSGLQTLMPALKRINRLQLNPLDDNWKSVDDFPFHAIQNLGVLEKDTGTVDAAISFINDFSPKITNLLFELSDEEEEHSEELQHLLFQLGRRVSNSLTNLTCSPLVFTLLASEFDTLDRNWTKNKFPALETLELMGPIYVDIMDWFAMEDFCDKFPKLKEISLNFLTFIAEHDLDVNGPNNRLGRHRRVESVKTLIMKSGELNSVIMEFLPRWLYSFPNITHLDLTQMPFKYDCDDRAFAGILDEINNLPLLEELTIISDDLSTFSLDHLFMENILEVEKHLGEKNLKHLLVYKTSLLDSKTLKKINIHGLEVCNKRVNNDGDWWCYSGQPSGTFLVSNRTAQLISEHRPGFTFNIFVTGDIAECLCSGVYPGGFRLEHLEPHAKISSKEITPYARRWEITF